MLWSSGVISSPHFYISGYFEEHKGLYIDTMSKVSENGDWTGWCVFFLEAVEKQAKNNLSIVEEIKALHDEMKGVFREKLASRYHDKVLEFIFSNPLFKNNKFTKNAEIPTATAYKFIKTLTDDELLKTVEEAAGRRPALYAFAPLMKIIRV